jgi:uncharacterized RDD family membrane protein YckC
MKTNPRQFHPGAALACFVALTLAALAQDPTPPAAEKSPPPPAPAASASAAAATAAPSTTAPAATSAAPAATTTAPAPAPAAPEPTAAPVSTDTAPKPSPAAEAAEKPDLRRLDTAPTDESAQPVRGRHRSRNVINWTGRIENNGNGRLVIGEDVTLAKGETADSVVAVFGSATSEGAATDAVVSVFGNTRVTGNVGRAAWAVLGNTFVDGKVGDAVVAVLGDVELGPNAEVGGDVVAIGGTVKKDPKAIVHGHIQPLRFGHFQVGGFEGLRTYFSECVFKARPLAIAPHLGWAWWIAGSLLFFYIVLALLFRSGLEKCVGTLETRPGSSVLAALLTLLLTPVLIVLLCVTVVGIAVVPFLAIALFIATLFGKAAMLAWLGRRITRFFGDGPLAHPAVAVLLGGLIVLGLYLVPVVGLIVYKLLAVLGLGVVVYTLLLGTKREKSAMVAADVAATPPPAMAAATTGVGAGEVMLSPAVAPPVVPAVTLPRAGFWIRCGALAIDVILVGIVASLLPFGLGATFLLPIAIYAAIMWALKGTTVGGIVCGLRVVRLDQRPLDWTTAIVRALGCFLSLFVIGLGFIWVAIDDEKQSWHDKIAGTTVVLTRGASLV